MHRSIAIVGAGISGLACAWQIRKRLPNAQLSIFEKNSHAGGNIRSERTQGFLVEHGPNGFLDNKPSTLQLCKELGLGHLLVSASEGARKNRYVFWDNRLQPLPNSFGSFLGSRLLSWRSKWQLMTEQFRRTANIPDDESIDAFARRRTGDQIADIIADAMVTGIHGGDPKLLSLPAAFPRLAMMEREFGSVGRGMKILRKRKRLEAEAKGEEVPKVGAMWTFRDGLGVLIDKLASEFRDELQLGIGLQSIGKVANSTQWRLMDEKGTIADFDAVFLTTPAHVQSRLLEALDSELSRELVSIVYAPIAVIALGFNGVPTSFPLDGFGYLVPQSLKRDILGVQWCSSIYEGRAEADMTLWRVLCGGRSRPEMIDWSDERLLHAVKAELKVAMGVSDNPIFHRIIRWPKAIPQYALGHLERLKRIENHLSSHFGLYLGGNAFHGVGLNDCTEQAGILAERVFRQFDQFEKSGN